jgi:hypothetical protein
MPIRDGNMPIQMPRHRKQAECDKSKTQRIKWRTSTIGQLAKVIAHAAAVSKAGSQDALLRKRDWAKEFGVTGAYLLHVTLFFLPQFEREMERAYPEISPSERMVVVARQLRHRVYYMYHKDEDVATLTGKHAIPQISDEHPQHALITKTRCFTPENIELGERIWARGLPYRLEN